MTEGQKKKSSSYNLLSAETGAMLAVGHVEDVDAVVLFWFVAADEEGVDVVAHCGVCERYWGRRGREGRGDPCSLDGDLWTGDRWLRFWTV